jgi:phospholipid/cholesterol/gamma-HCH transport system substrate-binding protein
MRGFSTELKVGIFAIAVLVILSFMTFKVGGFDWTKTRGYRLFVFFDNIGGLDVKTRVKVAGVDAGVVNNIELVRGKAMLELFMNPEIKIYGNAVASIKTTGLLGDKFLDIEIGSPDSLLLKDGDTIGNAIESVDIDDLARNVMYISKSFTELSDTLNEIIGTDEARSSLRDVMSNLKDITTSLSVSIEANDQKLKKVLDNLEILTASIADLVEKNREPLTNTIESMDKFSDTLRTSGPEVIENLNKASIELKKMVEESGPMLSRTAKSMDKIADEIDKGEGSLGKLIKDDRLYESINKAAEGFNKTISSIDRFRTYVTFQAEYLTKPDDGKAYFYVTLQPKPNKYYVLGVVGDNLGNVSTKETTTTPPGTIVKEEEIEEEIEFTVHYARRLGDAAMRLGLTENTFGIGGDYFFNSDKGKVTADIWDFSNDEEGSDNPHLKIGVDYFLFKNLFLSAGADNILNERWRGGYFGVGLRFEDEDFKYLLGNIPSIPTN